MMKFSLPTRLRMMDDISVSVWSFKCDGLFRGLGLAVVDPSSREQEGMLLYFKTLWMQLFVKDLMF